MIRYILVDDDDSTLAFVKNKIDSISKAYGLHHIRSYNNSKLAYESIKENEYDLLIVDFEMPVYNGMELAQRIAQEKKVIFLTSTVNNEQKVINNVDIAGYLSKPFDIEEFEIILKNKIIKRKTVASYKKKNNHFLSIGTNTAINIQLDNTYYISRSKNINGKQPKKNNVNIYGKEDTLLFENVRLTIKDLEQELKSLNFVKINQSTIVNRDFIKVRDNINVSLYDCKETFVLAPSEKVGFLEKLLGILK